MDADLGEVLERGARRAGQRRKRGGNPRGERGQFGWREIGEGRGHGGIAAAARPRPFYNVRVHPEAFPWI